MRFTSLSILSVSLAGWCGAAWAQAGGSDADSYRFRMAVDEVVLTFHAEDAHGRTVNDLRLEDLQLLDDGAPPATVLAFAAEPDLPVRIAILLDTSTSMHAELPRSRSVAEQAARRMVRLSGDAASVTEFGYAANQDLAWSANAELVSRTVRNVHEGRMNPLGGTSLYDAVFRTCFYATGKTGPAPTGKVLLLLSDGQDNASHTTLEEAAATCQHSNTAVYAFTAQPGSDALRQLAAQTGGLVFRVDDDEATLAGDLQTMENAVRTQYRLVYRPARLKHDGAFHRILLSGPPRVTKLSVRSGYYAPEH